MCKSPCSVSVSSTFWAEMISMLPRKLPESSQSIFRLPTPKDRSGRSSTLIPAQRYSESFALLDLLLKVLARDQVGDVVVISLLLALALRHVLLVALSELAQRGQRVGAKLVQDTGNELGKLLVLTVAVDGKGVGGNSGVDCVFLSVSVPRSRDPRIYRALRAVPMALFTHP